jgi:hypothetical protein
MSVKKSPDKKPVSPPPEPEVQEPQETKPVEPLPEVTLPQTEKPKPLTLISLNQELQSLKQKLDDHSSLITQLQETLARKRKPVTSNGKVQIRDKETGTVYPSNNNAYQSLLKSGALKELVSKGLFGDVPEKNTFGWYTLVREWPDRFEEVPPEEKQA